MAAAKAALIKQFDAVLQLHQRIFLKMIEQKLSHGKGPFQWSYSSISITDTGH